MIGREKRFVIAGLAALAATGAAAAPAAVDGGAWRTYVNVRYRYAVCWPADLLKAEPEASNGDGRTFEGADGAELAVFGRNDVDHVGLAASARADSADMAGRDGQVTYRASRGDWAVYSGRSKAGLFYGKTIRRGDQLLIFQLKYPESAAAAYRPVVERLQHCFAATR